MAIPFFDACPIFYLWSVSGWGLLSETLTSGARVLTGIGTGRMAPGIAGGRISRIMPPSLEDTLEASGAGRGAGVGTRTGSNAYSITEASQL